MSDRRVNILAFVNTSVFVAFLFVFALLWVVPHAGAAGVAPQEAPQEPSQEAPFESPVAGPPVQGTGTHGGSEGPNEPSEDDGSEPATDPCDEGAATDERASATVPPGVHAPRAAPQGEAPSSSSSDAPAPEERRSTEDGCGDTDLDPPTDKTVIPVPPGVQPIDLASLVETLVLDADGQTGPPAPTDDPEPTAKARAKVVAPDAAGPDAWSIAATLGLGTLLLLVLWRLRGLLVADLGRIGMGLGYRLDHSTLLDHPVRKEIVAYLTARPGATMGELVDACGVGYGRVSYHLRMLVREQVLRIRIVDGTKHYVPYVAARLDEEQVRLRHLTHSRKVPGRILGLLQRAPGVSVSDIARTLGLSPGHAHYHLTRLRDHGLVRAVKQGRRSRHYMTERGAACIDS